MIVFEKLAISMRPKHPSETDAVLYSQSLLELNPITGYSVSSKVIEGIISKHT